MFKYRAMVRACKAGRLVLAMAYACKAGRLVLAMAYACKAGRVACLPTCLLAFLFLVLLLTLYRCKGAMGHEGGAGAGLYYTVK